MNSQILGSDQLINSPNDASMSKLSPDSKVRLICVVTGTMSRYEVPSVDTEY